VSKALKNLIFAIDEIDVFIFDFDGVLTNNMVHVDQNGNESVICSRSDGLAFEALRKMGKISYIFSTEKNPIVSSRANKLKVPCIQGVENKLNSINELCNNNDLDLDRVVYVGNDINDYQAMRICGFKVCPADSHELIKSIADVKLRSKGGDGVVRELLEESLNLNLIKILYDD
jgi:3-deoxy-D-manno-octulosonate 8-phosphate phosphatase (KDO 8-P phosphatase)